MKLQTNNNQQPAVFRENAPIVIIILSIFIVGVIAIGVWSYLEMTTSEQTVNQFEKEVAGLVSNVNEKPAKANKDSKEVTEEKEVKTLAAQSNPFQSPLKRVKKAKKPTNNKSTKNRNNQSTKENKKEKVKKRIASKVRVLGLLGGPGKRLAIIGIDKDVQIVKPGDRIKSLIIKDINQKRVVIEEYGKELTYTFGGGQD
ncbi:hypothetical protein [Halanaerobacter jeridensis]|uniref:Tfp pilus assembly protein PilP n=1 Tax=Halanaerobacter jeridensis TaxID=706427 RepID=A0A939BT75_9FIRM|nr:hypothetical protein [Halanaerobacter jeridensis]MBM7557946.1 Tfp pilus assembly protein PilP [Halanaerobacter jeridensis]